MGTDNEERFGEQLWKSQEDDGMEITADNIRARALRYERQSVWAYRIGLAITPPFLAAFVYNLVKLHEPWLILGQAWALSLCCFIVWRLVRQGPNRIRAAESCTQYLRRELGGKREGLLWLRRAVLLLLPALLASWLGGGLIVRARLSGITSPFLLGVLGGNAPWIALALVLVFIWFAFTRELRKVEREVEKLDQQAR